MRLLTEEGVDFERVIPMPDNVIRGSIGHASIDGVYQPVFYPQDPDDPIGLNTKPQPYPPGAVDWYSWSIEHWGTKWNAYSNELDDLKEGRIKFDTAWSHPMPVIQALSECFPDQVIVAEYADEDLGSNLGRYSIQNGMVSWELSEEKMSRTERLEFATQVKYGRSYRELMAEWGEEDEIEVPSQRGEG